MPQDRSIEIKVDSARKTACHKCKTVVDTSARPAFSTVTCPRCGAAFATPGKIGPYGLLSELARGRMGVTYKGFEKALGRYVAIKMMSASVGKDPKRIKAFLAEGRALARLDHPNAMRVFSLGQEKGQPYIVMELVTGQSMGQLIEGREPMSEARVLEIATGVARALRAADRVDLTHGDVNPDNILLDYKGRAKLVDFSAARFGDGKARADTAIDTQYYIAPERVSGDSVDFRADIYSLGATLFHGLAGAPPFAGTAGADVLKARLEKPAPNLISMRQGLGPYTIQLVARMLEMDPDRRYQSYDDLLGDLHKACLAAGVESALEADADRAGPPRRLRRLSPGKVLVIAVVLAVACAAVWAMFFRGGAQPAPVEPLVRLAAMHARQSAESAIKSVPGFGTLDRPAGPWKQIAANANEAGAAFDRKDFVKARDLWTQVAVEIGERYQAAARDVNEQQGFILAWFVSGPYAIEGKLGQDLFDVAFGPEKNDKGVAWRPLLKGMDNNWAVDLNAAISTADNCAVYVRTRVHSPAAQGVRLELGSDDAVKVWLNGKEIHGKNKSRGMTVGEDVVRAKLSAGWNDLMLKVIDYKDDWGFCCRIRKPDGTPLNGLKIEAK